MDIGNGLAAFFNGIITVLVVIFITAIVMSVLYIGEINKDHSIKSKRRIIPEVRLTTDGRRIDTIFIYKKP